MTQPYICTKESPWDASKGTRVQHPDAVDVGECLDGCCDYYKCPNCGRRFTVEVAQ